MDSGLRVTSAMFTARFLQKTQIAMRVSAGGRGKRREATRRNDFRERSTRARRTCQRVEVLVPCELPTCGRGWRRLPANSEHAVHPAARGFRFQVAGEGLGLVTTTGESEVIRWLTDRGYQWEAHPDFGGKRPDFLVGGSVALEVTDPAFELPLVDGAAGSIDSVEPIRTAIKRKAEQGAAVADAGLPYVLVVSSSTSAILYGHFQLASAMHGNLVISLAVGDEATDDDALERAEQRFGGGGRLQEALNTRFSALAAAQVFNPTAHVLDDAMAREIPPDSDATLTDRFRIAIDLSQRLTESGVYDPDARAVRMLAVHNRYARHSLSPEFFVGPYDEQYGLVQLDDGREALALVFRGSLAHDVDAS